MMIENGAVIGVAIGDTIGLRTVVDISYSTDNRHIYLHLMRKRPRSTTEVTVKYKPLDRITYSTTRNS
jgi:hypothetical protein